MGRQIEQAPIATLCLISTKLPKQKPQSCRAVSGEGQGMWERGQPTSYCVEGSGTPLFGRNWLEEIQLNWAEIAKINGITSKSNNQNTPKGLQSLLKKYQEVFQEEMGQCRGV